MTYDLMHEYSQCVEIAPTFARQYPAGHPL